MSVVVEFEYRECRKTGAEGFIQLNAPAEYDVGGGALIAHDVLEHSETIFGKNTWEDEMMAIGAVMFVRGDRGYFSKYYNADPAFHLSSDIARCFASLHQMNRELAYVACEQSIGVHDETLVQSVAMAVKIAMEDCEAKASRLTQERCLWLLRAGYKKAEERFGRSWGALRMFEKIEGAVNKAPSDYETTLIVTADFENLEVTIEAQYE